MPSRKCRYWIHKAPKLVGTSVGRSVWRTSSCNIGTGLWGLGLGTSNMSDMNLMKLVWDAGDRCLVPEHRRLIRINLLILILNLAKKINSSKLSIFQKPSIILTYVFSIPNQFFEFNFFGTNQCRSIEFLAQWIPLFQGRHHRLIFIDFFALLLLNCHSWGETCCHLFQRFLEVLPFPRIVSHQPFSKGWSRCAQVYPFSKVSGSISFSKDCVTLAFSQRLIKVCTSHTLFKGISEQVPWDLKASFKPCNFTAVLS